MTCTIMSHDQHINTTIMSHDQHINTTIMSHDHSLNVYLIIRDVISGQVRVGESLLSCWSPFRVQHKKLSE